jgi:two-component system alkaline phosphatase synthesis response regulator PhoP
MTLRILMIEKDVTTTDLLVPSLERKGYEVTVSRSQRAAMGRIRSWRPDLLIVDVTSFGANGYKVSDAVRSRLNGVPTILLLDKGHASAGGDAQAFMTRPFSSRGLLHRLRKLAETLVTRDLCAGPLALDPDTRALRRGERAFYLRPKEATLLALFMRNAGWVLTRQEIMRQIWETDYMGDTRTLSVHVRWLREKIEEDPHNPRILRTVRGVGYRFEIPEDMSQV